jgi:hypothetical protein
MECSQCGTIHHHKNVCPVCDVDKSLPPVTPPPLATQDRLAALWEQQKGLLPDGELKSFICRAIMLAMEKWRGGEPPKARPLSVTVIAPCDHEWEFMGPPKNHAKCMKCGETEKWDSPKLHESPSYPGHPISPFANTGW